MRISQLEAAKKLRTCESMGLLENKDTTLHFLSKTILQQKLGSVKNAFPENAIHTVAVKANPLTSVLKFIKKEGLGLEAASFEELMHSRSVDCPTIGWDSPAKTKAELDQVLESMPEVIINCDSLDEARYCESKGTQNQVLLRVNPQLSGSAHQSMSVARKHSKFGEPISNRVETLNFLTTASSIQGLHVHTSSQTLNFEELAEGVRCIIDLAIEANKHRKKPLTLINIGGGFPVNYLKKDDLSIEDYVIILKSKCPELFNGMFNLITEFGRYYHANAGFSATQIAQVKNFIDHQVIICHAGADMLLREAYQPNQWHHIITLLDSDKKVKSAELVETDIAGPLCFGGDYVQKQMHLPKAEKGDWLIIHDTGANSIALWSKHCSRAFPKCIFYDDNGMEVIRDRDTLERNLSFWS